MLTTAYAVNYTPSSVSLTKGKKLQRLIGQ